jgi:hypothetical protein
MTALKFEVTDSDGDTRIVEAELSLDPSTMTLRETVRLEDAIGSAKAEQLFSGVAVSMTPKLIQAMVWAKLATEVPGLTLDGFDIPIGDFEELEDFGGEVVEMPVISGDDITPEMLTGTDSGNG